MIKRSIMNRLIKLLFFSSLTAIQAQNAQNKETKNFHVALPLGQTLPESVWRIRSINVSAEGSEGFDEKGAKIDSGFDVRKRVSATVVEYGATSNFSLQIMVPYIYENSLSIDGDRFRQTEKYKKAVLEAQKKIASKIPSFICGSEAACLDLIQSEWSLPHDKMIELPSGEKVMLRSKESIKSFSERLVIGAATPQIAGETGIGDMELGGLFNLFRDEHFSNSIALGLRLPTGSFSRVPFAYRSTGEGFYDLGSRWNLDYSPVNGLWFSYQQIIEWGLSAPKKERSSLVHPYMLRASNPLDSEPNHTISRKSSPKLASEAHVTYGFGAMNQNLKLFASSFGYKYQQDARIMIDQEIRPLTQNHYLLFTATADARGYHIPAALDLSYQKPIAGRNALISPPVASATFKLYAKF